ncbi:MAG: hypothetical protein MO846_12360 [Candidatus Devosia symbiotica]|nr:hypothetical protein [Candidatus Devosia symbiotica]
MTHLEIHRASDGLASARRHAREAEHLASCQIMLAAAGIAALSIVAVTATVMTMLL